MIGPPAASIPRHGDGEPGRRGGQRQLDQDRLPHGQQAVPGELALVNRFVRDVRKHGGWAKASRASGYYTAEDLDAFFDEYSELLARYGHGRQDATPGARLMQLRMFYIPDEPAEPEP